MHRQPIELDADVHGDLPHTHCPAFDGRDEGLPQWITDSHLAVTARDYRAVELERGPLPAGTTGPGRPLHGHCLFKLGVHLGEMWSGQRVRLPHHALPVQQADPVIRPPPTPRQATDPGAAPGPLRPPGAPAGARGRSAR